MTRTATHSRNDASSTPHRGRLAALAFVATLAIPVLARAALAQPEVDPNPAATLEFAAFDDKAFIEARKSGTPVVLYFESEGCTPCKQMHERTFGAPEVVQAAAGIRLYRVDLSSPDRQIDLLKNSFRVIGAPTVILFGTDGKESGRRFGFIPPDDFAAMLGESREPAKSAGLGPARSALNFAISRSTLNVALSRSLSAVALSRSFSNVALMRS